MSTRRTAGTVEVANGTEVVVSGTVGTTTSDGGNVVLGSTTDAAVTTDANGTISGKLRGLVKWTAERMPTSLGQKSITDSLSVVLASASYIISVPGDSVGGLGLFISHTTNQPGTDGFGTSKIPGMGLLGCFDDASPTPITENRFGSLRMSVARELYGVIRDAAGNERGANVDASNRLLVSVEGTGKTLKTKTGSASATFSIVAAVTDKKIKVYSLSLLTASTTAVTITFKDGASGTALATYPLQAITGTNFGITESVAVPSSLFEGSVTTLLEMAFSAAQTVTYNLRYWDSDAS